MKPSPAITRRSMLAAGACAAFAGCATARRGDALFFKTAGVPIGIQLFPLNARLSDDLDGTLAQIAAIGFDMVETAGLLGHSAAAFRAALDRAGLACRGMHVQGMPNLPGPSLARSIDAVIADAKALGASQIVMPIYFFPQGFTPPQGKGFGEWLRLAAPLLVGDDYRRMAEFLNRKGEVVAEGGLQLGYHNHNVEFRPLADGQTGMDILLAETDPALVTFELDIGWAAAAGVDMAALLRDHAGRFTQMHLKDIAPATPRNYALEQTPALLGEGRIDLPALLPLAHKAGVTGFFVEQEPPFDRPRIEAMAANYRFLATMRAV